MSEEAGIERCEGCGLAVAGGTSGCQAIFDELLARDFGDIAYFRTHRMMVDVYSLQHPDRYCASAKSLAAHLTGLAWLMEHDGNRAVGNASLRPWLDGPGRLVKPPLPAFRGALTVAHVRGASGPIAHASAVEEWARSTWEAYAPLHEVARQWIDLAYRAAARPAGSRRK
jgi:hypothetical protein